MADIYDVGDVIDKILVTEKPLPYYDSYPPWSYKQLGTFPAGATAGKVYSWIDADPASGRQTIWWMFYGANGTYYYMPHHPGDFNVDVLQSQGVLTDDQKNNPPTWYEKVLGEVLPFIAIAVIGAAAVKGYFSTRKQS